MQVRQADRCWPGGNSSDYRSAREARKANRHPKSRLNLDASLRQGAMKSLGRTQFRIILRLPIALREHCYLLWPPDLRVIYRSCKGSRRQRNRSNISNFGDTSSSVWLDFLASCDPGYDYANRSDHEVPDSSSPQANGKHYRARDP